MGTCILMITLNVDGLNASTRGHRLAGWVQKQDPCMCCLQETHFRLRDACRLKIMGWKKMFHENGDWRKAGVAVLISDKIHFGIKTIAGDKEGHYMMIGGLIQEEGITIVDVCAPSMGSTSIYEANTGSHGGGD